MHWITILMTRIPAFDRDEFMSRVWACPTDKESKLFYFEG